MNLPAVATDVALLNKLHHTGKVVLVPTMGDLHTGHLSLVRHARKLADADGAAVCVSIFVNPLQFGPTEDYDTYPRQLEADCQVLADLADTCFAPSVATMYPTSQEIFVTAPLLGEELCGQQRKGFFTGVLTVVLKLLLLVRPTVAVFGEKDWQQLVLIRKMVHQLHLPIALVAMPTIRETDGLACSSRNKLLDTAERHKAHMLHEQLAKTAAAIAGGEPVSTVCGLARDKLAQAGFTVTYLECRQASSLAPWCGGAEKFVVLGAAHLGQVRLIDNEFGCLSTVQSQQ